MTITFNDTLTQIVNDAFINVGVSPDQQNISDNDYQFAARVLNRMLKMWQGYDLHLWLQTEAILFLQQGQTTYEFTDADTGDNCTNEYIETTVDTDCTSGSSTIVVDDVTGMTADDYIGIITDDGPTFWTTIDSINVGTNTITLADAIDADASEGNFVHTYTTKIDRPLKIYQARRYNYESQQDVEMLIQTRAEYFAFPSKQNSSFPVQCYYDPQIGTGVFYVWGNPSDSSYAVKFTYLRQINDISEITDYSDLPTEWLEAIVFGLAYRLCPAYGQSSRLETLKAMADEALQVVQDFDREVGSIYLRPRKY